MRSRSAVHSPPWTPVDLLGRERPSGILQTTWPDALAGAVVGPGVEADHQVELVVHDHVAVWPVFVDPLVAADPQALVDLVHGARARMFS